MKKMTVDQNEFKRVLVTGTAGFVGFHFAKRLMADGYDVIGLDNLNDYYDVNLKLDRLRALGFSDRQMEAVKQGKAVEISAPGSLIFYPEDLKNREPLEAIFATHKPEAVVNLAAQAGVRYSLQNPYAYVESNLAGFVNILENCRHHEVKHLVYASSSSVYGSNTAMPFSVHHNVDHPISLYAATKKSNELMAHTYSHLYKIPTTGLRFFTVYGPWGRPDMAYFLFTKRILAGEPIEVFNHGKMKRDFTYIDDIVTGIYNVMVRVPQGNEQWDGMNPDPATSPAPYRLFNIGNHNPVELMDFIQTLEKHLGKEAEKVFKPMQKGDVLATYADTEALRQYTDFQPVTPIDEGLKRFVQWYMDYYGHQG